ncbi:DUF1501 domain-containing protein [Arenicella sp. 4NH20-0111]|uniref:DUF1501 domain-containing protein n=1 Tax=Arenicella sp. 4NH20-0111 TaxID=3127648 RepID=UPI00310B8136
MKNLKLNRRSFLKQCALTSAAGYTGAAATLGGLSMTANAAGRPNEYRAMVCVYLTGGNDLNMLVPNDSGRYQTYSDLRGPLAIANDEQLTISSGIGADQQSYGLHPACGAIKTLYENEKLAFVANVGALLEPTTSSNFSNREVRLPPKLFSHLSQKDFVRIGLPFNGEKVSGWAGRIADLYNDGRTPLNLSLVGDNVWQRGNITNAYALAGGGIPRVVGYRPEIGFDQEDARRVALDEMNQLSHENLLVRAYGKRMHDSLSLSRNLREGSQEQLIELTTPFPSTRLGQSLRNVARLINARQGLGMPQQTFYVNSAGWDHHDNLLFRHRDNLQELSDALSAFYAATEEMGLADQVVSFTNSDFGRTLVPNSNGSDHAWGGTQLVMGGKVDGGQVFGEFPEFSADDPQYIDFRGTLVPTISTDQMSATIAKWFGDFSTSEVNELFPNLMEFDTSDLGFML